VIDDDGAVRDEGDDAVAEPAEVPAPPAVTKTVEAWGLAKGLLPQITGGGSLRINNPSGRAKVVAVNLADLPVRFINPRFHLFAAAKAMNQWPVGKELTEAEFDAAVARAGSVAIR
jgi:hypothetical protein